MENDEQDMKIQREVEEVLGETIENLEDIYGIVIDCTFSWDYYEEQEEEFQ